MEDKKEIRRGQHGFTTGKSCLTSLIALYDETTTWMDEGRAGDAVCLDFTLSLRASAVTNSRSKDRVSGH